ncbi:isochorismatase family protein [Novosphingobium sp. 1949]|uniref:Isochorismatase family protein n=1 Tax=Novosphingobium organovorum TaxID=2930092 RepID=A0ABT0BD81_9SPHN|nr:isochorismatase family protein [Novosphingobium organovorum]MCJ2182761.1 isochorismatase family protein [Novosphingobium organovorum]
MQRFVIVVDTQGDFMLPDGALYVAGAEALTGPMRDWLAGLEPAATAGVLFTFDTHYPDVYAGSSEAEAFPIHCVHASAGWANQLDVALLDPAIPAWRIEKGVFDMWEESGLMIEDARPGGAKGGAPVPREAFFEALRLRGVTEVTVIGVAADYCVRWAVDGLVARGFAVTVPAALTRGIARQIETVVADDFAGAAVVVE